MAVLYGPAVVRDRHEVIENWGSEKRRSPERISENLITIKDNLLRDIEFMRSG